MYTRARWLMILRIPDPVSQLLHGSIRIHLASASSSPLNGVILDFHTRSHRP
jgi:hypothetical protein